MDPNTSATFTSGVVQLLQNSLFTTDPTVRLQSETELEKLSNENFLQYIGTLASIIPDDSVKEECRMLAALLIKNKLVSKDPYKSKQFSQRWCTMLDADSKNQIKLFTLQGLMCNCYRVANSCAQLVATIANIELPRNEWPELMNIMVTNTQFEQPEHIKRSALLALGYICEQASSATASVSSSSSSSSTSSSTATADAHGAVSTGQDTDAGNNEATAQQQKNNTGMNSQILMAHSNNILIAIVQGAQSKEPSKSVRLTALNALADSLSFIKENMTREGERNYLMQVICEATQDDDSAIQAAAFGCLCKIMSLYYAYMKPYMEQALYGLTISTMKSNQDEVASLAVEFWSTICEEENDITFELQEFPDSQLVNYNFALGSISEVIPTLLNLLMKQNEDFEDDDWNVSMSAGACLELYAINCGNFIVEPVLQFVEQNIGNTESWRNREAAIMAFGSILYGPDKQQLSSLVHQALLPILQLMNDDYLQLKESVAWCLGRIVEYVITSIDEQQLPQIIQTCLLGLQGHPKVITNCCWAIINLIDQLMLLSEEEQLDISNTANKSTALLNIVYQAYPMIIDTVLKVCERTDNDFSARASAFSCLVTIVENASGDSSESISAISSYILDKLGQTMNVDKSSFTITDRQNLEELQSNVLSVLSACIRKIPDQVHPVSDLLMQIFTSLLESSANSNTEETNYLDDDVFYAVSALASTLGADFQKYLETFAPYLVKALNQVDSQISITAVGLIGDISNSLGPLFKQCAPAFMNALGQMINLPNAKKELQPAVISVFGDIATNIGPDFVPYLDQVLALCLSAQNAQPENTSLEALDYNLKIHEAVLDAYVGIIAGLSDTPQALFPYIGNIFRFLGYVADQPNLCIEDSTVRAAVGLLGDIAAMYPDGSIKQLYAAPWVTEFIKKTKSNPNFKQSTRETAKWARDQQKIQLRL